MMNAVFEEPGEPVSDGYLDGLLGSAAFWAIAALSGDHVVGGLTAHTLPMTRGESSELFIFDVAVHADYRRQGIGRQLIDVLGASAAEAGIETLFVPADKEDEEALEFYRAIGGEPMAVTMFTFAALQPRSTIAS